MGGRGVLRLLHCVRNDESARLQWRFNAAAKKKRFVINFNRTVHHSAPTKVLKCAREHFTHKANISLRPSSILISVEEGSILTLLVKRLLSRVSNCETLTTEGLGSPDSALLIRTLPGKSARPKLEVIIATRVVAIRLSLNGLAWMISIGRFKPGPEPTGSGRSAHQISPRRTGHHFELRCSERGFKRRWIVCFPHEPRLTL